MFWAKVLVICSKILGVLTHPAWQAAATIIVAVSHVIEAVVFG